MSNKTELFLNLLFLFFIMPLFSLMFTDVAMSQDTYVDRIDTMLAFFPDTTYKSISFTNFYDQQQSDFYRFLKTHGITYTLSSLAKSRADILFLSSRYMMVAEKYVILKSSKRTLPIQNTDSPSLSLMNNIANKYIVIILDDADNVLTPLINDGVLTATGDYINNIGIFILTNDSKTSRDNLYLYRTSDTTILCSGSKNYIRQMIMANQIAENITNNVLYSYLREYCLDSEYSWYISPIYTHKEQFMDSHQDYNSDSFPSSLNRNLNLIPNIVVFKLIFMGLILEKSQIFIFNDEDSARKYYDIYFTKRNKNINKASPEPVRGTSGHNSYVFEVTNNIVKAVSIINAEYIVSNK